MESTVTVDAFFDFVSSTIFDVLFCRSSCRGCYHSSLRKRLDALHRQKVYSVQYERWPAEEPKKIVNNEKNVKGSPSNVVYCTLNSCPIALMTNAVV